jgi:monofunctional biosynthetic peptidoglycan transglycosylase
MEIYPTSPRWAGIFGAEAAARHHFGGGAREMQAALLVATLPNPSVRNPARPGPRLAARAGAIAERARKAGGYIDCLYP